MVSRLNQGLAYGMLCAIWGSTWLVIKIGLGGAPPFLAASLRFVIAFLTLLAIAAVLRAPVPRTRVEWGGVAFVGAILFTADYALIYWAQANGVESGLSAILFATMPLQTALFAHAFLKGERLTVQTLAGIALGFGGLLLVFRGELEAAGPAKFLPMLAIALSATCAASTTVVVKRWGHDANPFTFNAFAMGIGAAGLAALSVSASETWAAPSWPEGIGAILYLSLVGSVVAFVTYLWLLKQLPATSMSYIALVTPIIAVFLGYSLGNEALDPLALSGAAVTLGGIYLATSKRAATWVRAIMGTGAVSEAARSTDPSDPKG